MTAGRLLGWLLVVALLPLSAAVGSVATIVALVAAILLLPFVWSRDGVAALRREPAMQIFVLVFVALAVCFVITAQAPVDTIYAANFLSLLLAPAVFLAARRAHVPDVVMTIAILCLAGSLVAVAIAAYDVVFLNVSRFLGYYMGPNLLARLTLMLGFASLAGLFVTRSRWRFLFYLGPVAGLVVTYLSGTRGALPVFPAMTLVVIAFLLSDRFRRGQVVLVVGLAVVGLASLLLLSDRMSGIGQILENIATTGSTADASSDIRLAMLSAAWELFQQSPIFGHGWASFARVSGPYLGEIAEGWDSRTFQLHNDLANFAVAAGGVGVACFVALLAVPIVGALATPRDALFRVRLYCCAQLSVWAFVAGLTDLNFGYDLPTTLYAFLTAIVLGAFRPSSGEPAG